MGRPRAAGPGRRHRRLPPLRLDRRRTPSCASGSAARRSSAGWTSCPTGPGTCGRGRRIRTPRARASSSAATWTPCPTAAPSTAPSGWSRRSPRWTSSATAAGRRAGRSAMACFADEEGARFGVACAGSRLLTGVLDPDRARSLTDDDGTTMAEAMAAAGHDPAALGRDDEALRRIGTFLELHVEQGRALVDDGAAVGVASSIWPHGRWRLDLHGRADHAGTTRLADRDDPMLRLAAAVLAARAAAERHGTVATVGQGAGPAERGERDPVVGDRLARRPRPGSRTPCAPSSPTSGRRPAPPPSRSRGPPSTDFDAALRDRLATLLAAPVLPTGAGHDAGILSAAGVPTAMLFVRNPTGVSHSPAEHAEAADCRRRGRPPSPGRSRRWRDRLLVRARLARATAAVAGVRVAGGRRADRRRRGRRTGARRRPAARPRAARASRTRTRTPSTGRCAGGPTTAAARSGPGASGCTPSPPGSTPTATWRSPAPPTPRWRWPGSPASASSTTCTTRPAAAGTPTPTRCRRR